jgi:hypothetical protein
MVPSEEVTPTIANAGESEGVAVVADEEAVVAEAAKSTAESPGETTARAATSSTVASPSKGLQALTDDKGAISVLTPDGFTVVAEGRDQAWSIKDATGKATRIWGDPHVTESDGDSWMFKEQGSFLFGKNKVTVQTVPAGNGETYSSKITVYSGDERVSIDGIVKNKPQLVAVSSDGKQHDAQLNDGTVYERGVNSRGESWSTVKNGKKDVQGR